jgi:outer membrane murein-binding lipoprotein Lpp
VGIAAVLDKAGPALATGIVLAVLGGAASVVMAWRDLAGTSAVRFEYVASELSRQRADVAQLRSDFESFRQPGDRFTASDGRRHQELLDGLEKRLRDQEMRPPRLNPALDGVTTKVAELERSVDRLEDRLQQIREEQQRLCDRLAACKEPRR